MTARAKRIARIAEVRALRERMHEAASLRAAARVREAEEGLAQVGDARLAALDVRSQALMNGDRAGWVLADSMREVAAWQQNRLEGVRAERTVEAESRQRVLQASRRHCEQADAILRRTLEASERVDQRAAQAQSDDRYLARRHWNIGSRA